LSDNKIHKNEKHLLEMIAERLGCTYLSDLRSPEYRERARKELCDGMFAQIDTDEYRDAVWYLAPPMKSMLYGTVEDQGLLLQLQNGREYFSDLSLYDTYDAFCKELCSDTYEIAICMVDGDPGFEAVKAAHLYRPDTPMVWFPKSSTYTLDTACYDCVLCGMQHQLTELDLAWAVRQCQEKLYRIRSGNPDAYTQAI